MLILSLWICWSFLILVATEENAGFVHRLNSKWRVGSWNLFIWPESKPWYCGLRWFSHQNNPPHCQMVVWHGPISTSISIWLKFPFCSGSIICYMPKNRCRISPGIFFPWGFFFLICSVFRPLHLSCHFPSMLHAICSILELEPFTLRVICSILELEPSMLHAICSILELELSILHAICRIWAQEPSIYHAICRICAQEPFSLRAICRIWELEPSMLLCLLLLRLFLLCLLLCCLLL